MASSSSRKIILKSADNELYEIGEKAAMLSQTIKNLIEDIGDSDKPILLQNVTSKVLPKVIEYCNKHAEKQNTDDDDVDDFLKDWDADFLNVDQDTLFDLMLAANYLDIKSLLDSTCQCVADMMKGKTAEEIREHFNIRNDYTPEQEEEVRKENQWAFE